MPVLWPFKWVDWTWSLLRSFLFWKNIHNSTPPKPRKLNNSNTSKLDLSALVKQNEMLWFRLWKIASRPSRSCDLSTFCLFSLLMEKPASFQLLSMLFKCYIPAWCPYTDSNLITAAKQACKNKVTVSFVYHKVRRKENYVRWQRTTFHTDVVGISSNFMGDVQETLRLDIYCKNLKQPS